MANEQLVAAAQLLQNHYGRLDVDSYRGWPGVVQFLLERLLSKAKFAKAWPEIAESWLMSVEDVAAVPRSELLELLQPYGGSPSTVALLHRLAVWWQRQVETGETPFEPGAFAGEAAWAELARQDTIWVTRLFSVLGGLRKMPVNRGVWRVACRHRWMSWHEDPEEIPGYFEQGVAETPWGVGQLGEWLIQVGDDYCGTKPKCAGCPLEPLLGENGVCEPAE